MSLFFSSSEPTRVVQGWGRALWNFPLWSFLLTRKLQGSDLSKVIPITWRERQSRKDTHRKGQEPSANRMQYKFDLQSQKKLLRTKSHPEKGIKTEVPVWAGWTFSGCRRQPQHCGKCCCLQSSLRPPSEERCLMLCSGECHSWAWWSTQKRESHLFPWHRFFKNYLGNTCIFLLSSPCCSTYRWEQGLNASTDTLPVVHPKDGASSVSFLALPCRLLIKLSLVL